VNPACCSCSKLAKENARLIRWLHADVHDRLVEHLASLVTELDGGALVVVRPPTQAQIAKVIGSSRESVSRSLTELKRAGHVTARQRCGSTTRITVSRELMNMAARVVMNGSAA
jgi:CRP-like cAMP-binding protein